MTSMTFAPMMNISKILKNNARKTRIASHYEVKPTFYDYLGNLKSYSCNLWTSDTKDNDEAARNKWDLFGELLELKAPNEVLEMGYGWGECAKHLVEKYRCAIYGINVCPEQKE